jgi:rare lipoprotein A
MRMTSLVGLTITSLAILLLSSCARPSEQQDGAPRGHVNVNKIPNATPKNLPRSLYGNPDKYTVNGRRYYVLHSARGYSERGIASWYGTKFHGHLTSTREPYDMYAMTAASPNLPLPTFVRVTNLENGRQIIVKVNDRGPFAANRIMDLSYVAAIKLGMTGKGTALVQIDAIDPSQSNEAYVNYKHQTTTHVPVMHNLKLYLQAGAFRSHSGAVSRRNIVRSMTDQAVSIVRIGSYYKVIIGPIKNVATSDYVKNHLANKGVSTVTAIE